MLTSCVGALWCFALLTAMGIGPVLWCLDNTDRYEAGLCLSPAVGLALFACCGTYFIVSDVPVHVWAGPFSAIAASLGVILALWRFRSDLMNGRRGKGIHRAYFLGAITVIVLLFAPPLIGGPDFIAFRGNGDDTLIYATLGQYLGNEPYHLAFRLDMNTIEAMHPLYPQAVNMLNIRWTTSMLLAVFSQLTDISQVEFEPFLGLLLLLSSFGPAYLIARSSRVPPLAATVSALVVCVGFWGQLVLDIQAMSHLNALPLVLTAACLFIRLETRPRTVFHPARGLLGFLMAAIIFTYMEMTPILLSGVLLYVVFRLAAKDMTLRQFSMHGVSLLTMLVLFLPRIDYFWRFFTTQATNSLATTKATATTPWFTFYFNFLNTRLISSLWGVAALEPPESVGFILRNLIRYSLFIFSFVLSLFSMVLTGLFLKDTTYRKENPATLFLICMSAGGLLCAVALYLLDHPWPAAKALTYIAPFCILTPTALVASRMHDNFQSKFIDINALLVAGWLVICLLPGLLRPVNAGLGTELEHSPNHHALYRKQPFDLAPIHLALKQAHQHLDRRPRVAVSTLDPWTQNYLILAISSQSTPVTLSRLDSNPDVLPVDFTLIDLSRITDPQSVSDFVVARAGNFGLLRLPPDQRAQLCTLSFDFFSGQVLFGNNRPGLLWIQSGRTSLTILSGSTGFATLSSVIWKGPAWGEKTTTPLRVIPPQGEALTFEIPEKRDVTFSLPVHPGENTFILEADTPSPAGFAFALEQLTIKAFVSQEPTPLAAP